MTQVLGHHPSHVELFFSWDAASAAESERSRPAAASSHRESSQLRFKVAGTMAGEMQKATELEWDHTQLVPADGGAIARVLDEAGRLEKLKYIYLFKNDLRDAGVCALVGGMSAKRLPNLRQLHLDSNRVGDQGCAAIAEQAEERGFPRLDKLTLHDNWIGDDGVAALLGVLDTEPPTLHISILTLYHNSGISQAMRRQTSAFRGVDFVHTPPDPNECTRPEWGDWPEAGKNHVSEWIPDDGAQLKKA